MDEPSERTWGIRFNGRSSYLYDQKGEYFSDCPNWLNPSQKRTWQEDGLVVWNNLDKKIEHLNGSATLRLLDQLLSDENWKVEGISITLLTQEFNIEIPHRGRNKKVELEAKTEVKSTKPFFKEIVHLPSEAGEDLINLLQMNKDAITRTAEFEKQRRDQAMKVFLESVLKFSRQKELDEIDLKARSFNWQRMDISRWTCQHQTTKGRVCLSEDKWFWCGCADRPGLPKRSKDFAKLQDAIEWVETEIVELANQPEPEVEPSMPTLQQIEAERARLREKLHNGTFWIDPSYLEAKRPTYKVFIDLDAEPVTYKTYKSSCDDFTFRYDERFLSPLKMSTAINLDFDRFSFEQPLGDDFDWYTITSLAAYYQESAVAEQAQRIWDQSQILQQFKAGKIKRARYGYKEVETGYKIVLGACEKQENSWVSPESREDYFATEALRFSICYALEDRKSVV